MQQAPGATSNPFSVEFFLVHEIKIHIFETIDFENDNFNNPNIICESSQKLIVICSGNDYILM